MTACTVLATNPGDVNLTAADMSLCYSLMHGGIEDQNNKMIRNSTVLADCFNINQDFVPNEISVIEGEILNCLTYQSFWHHSNFFVNSAFWRICMKCLREMTLC